MLPRDSNGGFTWRRRLELRQITNYKTGGDVMKSSTLYEVVEAGMMVECARRVPGRRLPMPSILLPTLSSSRVPVLYNSFFAFLVCLYKGMPTVHCVIPSVLAVLPQVDLRRCTYCRIRVSKFDRHGIYSPLLHAFRYICCPALQLQR